MNAELRFSVFLCVHRVSAVNLGYSESMDVRDYLSDDGQAVLALCSAAGISGDPDASQPFKLSEWNELERQIESSSLKQPGALQGRSASELAKELELSEGEAERIVRLLDRSGSLALELESLFSRGLWAVTRVDESYPAKLRDTLKHQAPTVLFGAGDIRLLERKGVAVVGSRNLDEGAAAFAHEIGRKIASSGMAVVSGAAKGADKLSMEGAMEEEGVAIGALADSLEATVRKSEVRELLLDGRLVLITPYAPTAGFSVGAAMGRNKIIYGLADFAVVVQSDFQTGGTWAGGVEALKAKWCPIFVRGTADTPKGNRELLKLGAASLPEAELAEIENLPAWFRLHAKVKEEQGNLFG
jgi:predicted Rossmann fold nucleotide-binding protein DprA/Smf involved in DNA uptake